MGGFADVLGTLAIDIVGDYSQLAADLDGAVQAATAAGDEIAQAFNTGAADDIGHYAQQLDQLGPSVDQAAESLKQFNAQNSEVPDIAHHAEDSLDALKEKVIELAKEFGATLAVAEVLKETFEAFSKVESATIALTALTGSAEAASGQLEALEALATSENLSFPALLEADQRMVAFGFDLGEIPDALQAVANASIATNESIDQVANSFERIVASGMISSRTLVQLGLTMDDLANTMGVTQDQVKALFQAMDQSERIAIVDAALQKFKDQAADAADTLKGKWQEMKNAFESFFVDAGNLLEGFAKAVLTVFSQVARVLEFWVDAVRTAAQAMGVAFTYITQGAAAAVQQINALAAAEKKTTTDTSRSTTTLSTDEVIAGAQMIAANAKPRLDVFAPDTDKFKAIEDYTSDIAIMADQLANLQKRQRETTQEIANFGEAMEAAGHKLSAEALPGNYFYDLFLRAADGMAALENSMPPLIDDMGNLSKTGDRTALSWAELNKQSKEVNKSLDDMLGKMKPTGTAVQELMSKFDAAIVSDDWRKAEQEIGKIAKDDLPTAVKAYGTLIAAAEQHGATLGEVLGLQEKQLQLEINYGAQTGTDATQQMIALKNLQIQTQLLTDKSQALGQVYVDLANTFMNAWGEFANGISDAITNSKNFGDAMMSVLKRIEQEMLNTLIGYVFKQMRDSLLQSSGLLSGIISKVQGLAGGGVQGGTMSGPAMLGAMGGGGSASGAGGLLSGLGGLGGIAAIGSLVTGVIGLFQGAHENKVLGEIELNTRSCFNVLAQMQGSLTGIGPYASLASKMAVSGPAASTVGGGGSSVNFNNCTFSGLTQDMVNALFASALRQFKAAGG